ncbi:RDD family protein [Caldanaerobacter subterraneus]|uniref:RDD family protein n=1 Tax=Caldanaerobacter subterraneus TaxID=911092 RepID=A0A7Y2L673_9THEO|nr:RDD family protein [Caldanaerobacter subterraneus]NNG66392.1 RDD family protein [Caldanaerobacter subterraneus]
MKYAGFWRRFGAMMIDSAIFTVIGLLVYIPVAVKVGFDSSEGVQDLIGFIIFIGAWLYFSIMESSKLQATLGKMALRIKVTDLKGNRISFGRATLRYWAKILSSLILYIGYLMAGWTKRKQALHDMIAGCLVVKE